MEDAKMKGSRKRKMKIEKKDSTESASKIPKRQTRSSAAAVIAESAEADRKKWTMFHGYDKINHKSLLKSNKSIECSEEIKVELPPKLMNFSEIPATGKITTYSKTSYLQTITMVLHDSPKYEILEKSNLYPVFKIPVKKGALSGRLLHHMLGRMLLTRKKYEMWFIFGNRPIKYSLREFALVTGLDCGPYPMTDKEWKDLEKKGSGKDGYWWELFGPLNLTHGLIKDIAKFLVTDRVKPAGKRISDERRLKLCLIVLVDGVLCCKNCAAVKASPTTVELVRDVNKFLKFPWGRLAFELSLEMVRVGTSSNPTVGEFLQRYNGTHVPMKGLSIAFQLVFLKAIPALNNELSKPRLDTTFADPKLKAKDLKDCRDITNDILVRLDNSDEIDIYSTVQSGCQLVSSILSWDDEVEDISVDLLETLLLEAHVFKSTDWVKGTIDPIDIKVISVFGRGERVPTKKVIEKEKGKGKESGIGKREITDLSDEDEEECFEGNQVVMSEIIEAVNDWQSDVWSYQELTRKGLYKKVNRILSKHNVTVPDVSGLNEKVKSSGSLRLHDSESGSLNSGNVNIGDNSNIEERQGEDRSSTDEHTHFAASTEEVLQTPVRPIIYFENVEEAIGMVKNLGDLEIGTEEGSKNEEVIKKGNDEVENVEAAETTVEKGSGGDDDVEKKNDSLEKEGDRIVEGTGLEATKQQVEEEGKNNVEEMGAVEAGMKNDEILYESARNVEVESGVEKQSDVREQQSEEGKEKAVGVDDKKSTSISADGSGLEKYSDVGQEPQGKKQSDKAKEKAVRVINKKSISSSASGSELFKTTIPINLGFEPVSDEMKTAFKTKLDSYVQKSYMINDEKYPSTLFEEISLPGIHSTDNNVMGLLVDTMWSRLRPSLEKKRIIMYGPLFPSLLVSEFNRLMDFCSRNPQARSDTKFLWSATLSNYLKGNSSTRPGKNRWFVNVDRIYAPMIWDQKKHWVSLCIDLVNSTVSVFDCLKDWTNDEEFQKIMNPICSILPMLIEGLVNWSGADIKRPKYFTYGRSAVSQDPGSGNSAMFALKFMELHSQGLSLKGITTEMVANFRMNYAIEFYERLVMPVKLY